MSTMHHTFTPDSENPNKCSHCKRAENTHGICECCPGSDTLVTYKTMKMCRECYEKEKQLTEESILNAKGRVADLNAAIRTAQSIDASIQVDTDRFNAATVSIAEIKSAIDADTSIPAEQKDYKLAELLMERYKHCKQVFFEAQQKAVEAGNYQRAIQTYLNAHANKLRQEEREKLKIQDINYKPNPVAATKSVKKISDPTKKKYTQKQIMDAAKEAGAPLSVIQALVIAQNMSPEAAVNIFKQKMAEQMNNKG